MRKFFKNASETQHTLTHTRDGGKRSRECNNTEILVNTHARAHCANVIITREREKKKRMKNGESAQKKKKTMVKGQLSLKSFFCHDVVMDDDVNDDEEKQRRKRSVDFEEEGVKEEKTETKKTSRDDDCVAAQPETNNKRAKTGFEEEEEDKEDKEKDNEKFTIPERDSKLRERFNAKLVAKATTTKAATTTSTLNIRGRGHAFKKQREEEDEVNVEKLDEIEPRDKKLTPLEAQVRDFKRKYPSVLLLFEVGYKFHFYGKDARKAAETLNVFAYPGKTWLQASGPVHRLAVYVRRLVNAGHKVGVVRQTETAALKAEGSTKGSVFTRELVALYTKATMDAGVSIAAEPSE